MDETRKLDLDVTDLGVRRGHQLGGHQMVRNLNLAVRQLAIDVEKQFKQRGGKAQEVIFYASRELDGTYSVGYRTKIDRE